MMSTKRQMWGSPMPKTPRRANASRVGVFIKLRRPEQSATIVKSASNTVTTNPTDGSEPKTYEFTQVFTEDEDIATVFDVVARPSLDPFIEGLKDGLIFTYGVTGAGKTYTMEGPEGKNDGLIYRTFEYIFKQIQHQEDENTYTVNLSCVELYGEELRDLLSADKDRKLKIQSDSRMRGETRIEVHSVSEASRLYKKAKSKRTTLETNCNDSSSRGHLVLTIRLEKKSADGSRIAQMCLVDLAGSERTKISGVSGCGMEESKSINKSLFILGKCIKDLKDNKFCYSYRESNLTKLFKSYFDGKGQVSLILCINPKSDNFNQNLFAMEFGTQTKDVKVDYASPPKQLKRSRSRIQLDKETSFPDLLQKMLSNTRENLARRKGEFEEFQCKSKTFRQSICHMFEENSKLKQEVVTQTAQLKKREDLILNLESQLNTRDDQNERLKMVNDKYKSRLRELNTELEETNQYKTKYHRMQKGLSNVIDPVPSAPMHSSSPIPTPETGSSNTVEYNNQSSRSPSKQMSVPSKSQTAHQGGVPVINPKHNRSLSCSSLQWVHHKPPGTIDTGTVLRPKLKNGRSVKNLRSSDILRRDAAGYSVVHQDADPNGDVETKVYKGHIISTVCGGAQVILDDIETMKQESPDRRRATSDVHYNF